MVDIRNTGEPNILNHKDVHKKRGFFIDALHIFVLFSFALAQPLFDLLSRYAEFFVARKSEPIDIVLLIFILCILLPGIAVLIEAVSGFFGRHFRKAVHWFMVATLSAAIALQVLNKIFEFPGILLIMMAAVLGISATIAYVCLRPARIFLTVLCPVILIFPGLFIFNSSVYKVVFPEKDPSAFQIKIDDPPPIIMVVFDEFPVTSLMDEDGKIDPIRYPNFAALAEDAYWFRNATSLAAATTFVIPSMLSGNSPDRSRRQATAAAYPKNMFTLLGGVYDLKVFETRTRLCPIELYGEGIKRSGLAQRLQPLLVDLSVIYAHIIFPHDLAKNLPIITQDWMGFIKGTTQPPEKIRQETRNNEATDKHRVKAQRGDRESEFLHFVDMIEYTNRPTFYFMHILLPHRPWQYLPSGKLYNPSIISGIRIGGAKNHSIWSHDELKVKQSYQFFLLQVGFVDRLLGMLIEKLKTTGIYERSLVIVTADHGMSFRPGEYARIIGDSNSGDITSVPLFIKAPDQTEGVLSDVRITTVDVLPTIGDILGIQMPWSVDGRSLLQEPSEKRLQISFLNRENEEALNLTFDSLFEVRDQTLKWKLSTFGTGKRPDGLYKIGRFKDLLGKHLKDIDGIVEGNVLVELDHAMNYEKVDLASGLSNANISGIVFPKNNTGDPLNLAISVNDTIWGVTRALAPERGASEWSVMVPEKAFRPGKNDIEVFIVSSIGGRDHLERMRVRSTATYTLVSSKDGSERITCSDGIIFPVIRNRMGHIGSVEVGKESVAFEGWAADVKNSQLAESVVVFSNGKFRFSGRTKKDRPDVAKHFKKPVLLRTGFKFICPASILESKSSPEVRLFALAKSGIACELIYPKGYMWGRGVSKLPLVTGGDKSRQLTVSQKSDPYTFSPLHQQKSNVIISSNGRTIPVIKHALRGHLAIADIKRDQLLLAGWAADVNNSKLPEAIIILVNGKFFYSGKCDIDRPDVAKHFGKPALLKSGFKFRFPLSSFKDLANAEVRIFAVSKKGTASELIYPKGYRWRKKDVQIPGEAISRVGAKKADNSTE